ncbi:hypothetical protein [Actinoplanes awajinensis]|nr:hypothetical protein [Actinoplanes awajinensis]
MLSWYTSSPARVRYSHIRGVSAIAASTLPLTLTVVRRTAHRRDEEMSSS